MAALQHQQSKRGQYKKLENPSDIRLLYLYPGSREDELKGELVHANLDTNALYVALSYVWGEPLFNHTLFDLDGEYYPITESLWNALRDIRSAFGDEDDEAVVIWADAICINQSDIAEREQQVSLMGKIYREAISVCTYIGPAIDLTPKAVELASKLWSWTQEELKAGRGPVITDTMDEVIEKAGLPSTKDDVWRGFIDLFERPWSSRTWIVQESLLTDNMMMMCGETILPSWGLLPSMAYLLPRQMHLGLPDNDLQNLFSLRAKPNRVGDTLENYLSYCHSLQATDPRDKVYALLALAENTSGITPNYQKLCEQLYVETAFALLQHNGSLAFLSNVYSEKKLPLPSWVPDWSHKPENCAAVLQQDSNRACAGTSPIYSAGPTFSTIKIRSLLVDRVKKCTGLLRDEALDHAKRTCRVKNPCQSLVHCQSHIIKEAKNREGTYPEGGSYHEATWRTLFANRAATLGNETAPHVFAKIFEFDDGNHETELPPELVDPLNTVKFLVVLFP
jgi:Heterokaryon incompatibility protein (HET)